MPMTRYMLLIALTGLLCAPTAQAIERYYVVTSTDYDGSEEHAVMSADEFKAADKAIDLEARYHMRAIAAARAEWANEERDGSFTTSAIQKRKLKKSGSTYSDRGKAEQKVSDYDERDARRIERLAEKEKEKAKYNKTKPSKEKVARDKAREIQRRLLGEQCREVYLTKLKALVAEKNERDAARTSDASE